MFKLASISTLVLFNL